jgi:hypothetical protein
MPAPPPAESGTDLRLSLEVTHDGLEARLSGKVANPEQSPDKSEIQRSIVRLLKEEEVKNGVLTQAVRQAAERLAQGEELRELVVAKGQAPVMGADAEIELLVNLEAAKVGRQTQSGHIDFRDKGPLPVVEAGTPLARLRAARPGEPGVDVRGQPVEAPQVRMLRLRAGKGVELEQAETVAVAAAQGMVLRPEEDLFEVVEAYEVGGDVNFDTGHLDFPGAVKVSGAVLADFKVRCYRLEVNELEPGCEVEVRDDLLVAGGIMGARVKAGGKVVARFVRDSRITCGGDMVVESEIVETEVESEGRVVLTTGDGRLVNSRVAAIRGVAAGRIISSGSGGTKIRLGVRPEFEQAVYAARKKVSGLQDEVAELAQVLGGQREELAGAEADLRGLIAALKDPAQQGNREGLMSQVEMIKPLRENLKEGVASGKARLDELMYELQREQERLEEMEAVMPAGNVWLDVRQGADATTEIRAPRSSLTLQSQEGAFSARELMVKDKKTGQAKPAIQMGNLRSGV